MKVFSIYQENFLQNMIMSLGIDLIIDQDEPDTKILGDKKSLDSLLQIMNNINNGSKIDFNVANPDDIYDTLSKQEIKNSIKEILEYLNDEDISLYAYLEEYKD